MDVNDLITMLVEQNKSYKDMLFFAVGSIITILVIFLTANFFTMRKFREDEIEKIKTAVILDIRTNSFPEITEELNKKLDSSIATRLSKVRTIEAKLKTLEKDNLDTKGKLYYLEADIQFNDEIYNSAFRLYMEAGKVFLESDSMGHINGILQGLEKSAVKLPYVLSEVTNFNEFASKLGTEYQTQVSKINEILKTKDPLG